MIEDAYATMKRKIPEKVWITTLAEFCDPSDAKKRSIVEAAVHIISREGVDALTFESIGKKLSTTKANIRYHFQNKDDLIFLTTKLIVTNAQNITSTQVQNVELPQQKLSAIIDSAYFWANEYPDHLSCWIMYFYYSTVFTRYMRYYVEVRQTGTKRIGMILRALPRLPNLKSEPRFEELSHAVQNILTGQIFGLFNDPKLSEQSLDQTKKIIQLLLHSEGLKWS